MTLAPLVEEFEAILRGAVERRLRSDVPVVSYISGGLDSTVVLGMCSQQRGAAIPSFTIGLDRAGPDERAQAAEAAAMLGSPLFTTTVDRAAIAAAYPELVRAAEGPVLDTSCAALLRLAESVHDRGYKVVLTGEGADEALAGYVWYKAQSWADAITRRVGHGLPDLVGRLVKMSVAGSRAARLPTPIDWRSAAGATCALRDDLAGETGDLLERDEGEAGRITIPIPTWMSGPTESSGGIRSISRSMPATRSCCPGCCCSRRGTASR